MTNVNIGPLARATKWRKRYVRVWFGCLILAELAAISLTELEYYKIAEATVMIIGAPLLALYEHPVYLITIPIVFLLIRMVLRYKITALVIASIVFLAFPVWPLFYALIVQSRSAPDSDEYVLSAVFALPGLIASLVALMNEVRYRAAEKNLRYAGDLNLILQKNRRSKIFTLPERSILKTLGPGVGGVALILILVFIFLGVDSAPARGVIWGVVVTMGWVSYIVHKHNIRTADEVRQNDDRPPILILRSFKDDVRLGQVEAYPYTSPVDRMAQLLESIGPLVALPEPGVPLSFPDIGEVLVKNTEWQDEVNRYIRDSCLIIVFIGDGPGLLWEIEELFTRPEILQRTVLIFTRDTRAQESANFIRFLLLHDHLPVAEKLYHSIKSWQRTSTSKRKYFLVDPCKLDKWLPRSYVSDEPLLLRFSTSGNPLVISGPLVWDGYKQAFKRYVLDPHKQNAPSRPPR